MKYVTKVLLGWLLSIKCNTKKNELYFIIWGHIGEAVYGLSLLPELEKIKKRKINIITFEPYNQIAELYRSHCNKIIVLSKQQVGFIQTYSQSNVCFHHNYIGGGWKWQSNDLYLDVPNVYVPGLNYKIQDLGIPYGTKHSLITDPEKGNDKELQDLVNELEVDKGKTVLLIPYAQSAKELSLDFWEKIAACLNKNGYKVLTNVKDESENPIKGTGAAKIPLKYVINFIQYAGSAISIRCGLTDLISVSDSNVEVLYKVENEVDEVLAGIWSFKLGEENLLYKNRWLFREQKDYTEFIEYIEKKYRR